MNMGESCLLADLHFGFVNQITYVHLSLQYVAVYTRADPVVHLNSSREDLTNVSQMKAQHATLFSCATKDLRGAGPMPHLAGIPLRISLVSAYLNFQTPAIKACLSYNSHISPLISTDLYGQ